MRLFGILALVTFSVALGAPFANAAPASDRLYQKSYEQEVAHDPVGALATLEKIPKAEQNRYVFRLRRGWLQYLSGQHKAAVDSYKAAIALAPRALEPKLGAMLPLMALRRWQDARAYGESVLSVAPGTVLAKRRLAFCLYNLGRYAEAEKQYRAIVVHYPSDVEMIAGVGWSLLKRGRNADAKKAFAEVLAIAPNDPSASLGMAQASRSD